LGAVPVVDRVDLNDSMISRRSAREGCTFNATQR